ncbi:hypothetical protein [Tolypothrix sp. VBCCA 56010]|uniref:hypothetical protein n=1 Tax=Tolypothrix sp. VBCCA 56010 TaxID=3137731 RepID=UPI003D7CFBB3
MGNGQLFNGQWERENKVKSFSDAPCPMPHAPCPMPHAPCPITLFPSAKSAIAWQPSSTENNHEGIAIII